MAIPSVAPGVLHSPIYRIRGQRSRWQYPDERLTPEHCEALTNVNLSEFGYADVRGGYTKYNTTILAEGRAVGIFQPSFTTGKQVIVLTPTKAHRDTGAVRTDITGSLTLDTGGNDHRYRGAFIRDKLVLTNGADETFWVGASGDATALTGMPWTTCEDLIEHQGVLLALAPTEGGTKYTTRIRWCDINTFTFVPDITVWPDANMYELYEFGPPIIGGVVNFGRALIFKEDGLYPGRIEYTVGYLEYKPQDELRGFSPVAKNSFISRPEFVWGIAREGAFVIVYENDALVYKLVTGDVQDDWNALNQDRLKYAVSWVREQEHQIHTLLSAAGTTAGLDLEMVWDWVTGDISFNDLTTTMNYGQQVWLSDVEYQLLGGIDNYLYKMPSGDTDDGTGVPWTIKMTPNDLGAPNRVKTIISLHTLYRYRSGQQSASLHLFRDQGKQTTRSKTITFSATTGTGPTWNDGTIHWNDGSKWPEGTAMYNTDDFFVNRQALTVQPQWTGTDPASLLGFWYQYTLEE